MDCDQPQASPPGPAITMPQSIVLRARGETLTIRFWPFKREAENPVSKDRIVNKPFRF
jgi:hypothetical protein